MPATQLLRRLLKLTETNTTHTFVFRFKRVRNIRILVNQCSIKLEAYLEHQVISIIKPLVLYYRLVPLKVSEN